MTARSAAFDRTTLLFLLVLIALTALRIYALQISSMDLIHDEAQYWFWSRTPDWGYYTKPPMVAWAIAATTAIFGDAEWAVRLASPLAHAITALGMFALGRSMYGAWTGFWSGMGWLLIPAVWFSSSIISTDALLLPCWAIALFAAWRLMNTRAWLWAIAIGLAVGLGLQAKYTMLYFPLCAAIAAWRMPAFRAALGDGRWIVALGLAIILITPNIVWNFHNGFATATHTASNLDIETGKFFNIDEVFEFMGGQLLLVGPLLFLPLLWMFLRAARRASGLNDQDKFLLAFILPPLLSVIAVSFMTRANANWAVVCYVGSIVWLTGNLISSIGGRRLLAAAMAINIAIGAGFLTAITAFPDQSNALKNVRRSRGWEETAREIARRAVAQPGEAPFTAVLVDHRGTYFELAYYWRDVRRAGAPLPPVRMWLLHGEARNSAEAIDPMRAEEGGRVLVVHVSPDYLPLVAADFSVFRTVEHLTIPLGGGYTRDIEISVGEGFAPASRDAAFREHLLRMQRTD